MGYRRLHVQDDSANQCNLKSFKKILNDFTLTHCLNEHGVNDSISGCNLKNVNCVLVNSRNQPYECCTCELLLLHQIGRTLKHLNMSIWASREPLLTNFLSFIIMLCQI